MPMYADRLSRDLWNRGSPGRAPQRSAGANPGRSIDQREKPAEASIAALPKTGCGSVARVARNAGGGENGHAGAADRLRLYLGLPRRPRRLHPFWGSRKRRLIIGLGLAFGLLILAFLLLRLTGLIGRDPVWSRIQERGVWRVGMDPSFPPFEFLDATGRPVGLDVDLAEAIAGTWGVRVEIVGVGFDELMDAVHLHRVDSALSALPVVPHRTRDVSFSDPYVEAGLVLVVPETGGLQGIEDLRGRRVAVEWGSNGDVEARALGRQWDGALELVLRDSVSAALDALLAGEADAALVDAISVALHSRREQLRIVGPPVVSDPYVVVVPADAPQLLQAVNRALEQLRSTGALAEIQGRWLKPGE